MSKPSEKELKKQIKEIVSGISKNKTYRHSMSIVFESLDKKYDDFDIRFASTIARRLLEEK